MGKNKLMYTPLEIIRRLSDEVEGFVKAGKVAEQLKITEKVEWAVGPAVDHVLKQNNLERGMKTTSDVENRIMVQSYDHAIATVTLSHWQYCKQVFTFSNDFYQMLCDMEDFELEWSIFEYLPYETFYLELEGNEKIDGVVVKYDPKTPAIAYTVCFKDAAGINCGIVDPRESNSFKSFFDREVALSKVDPNSPQILLTRQVLVFTIQACMYLCATNADIEENPRQKEIYRPTAYSCWQMPKNRFSEIQKWDVGVRIVHDHQKAQRVADEYLISETAAGRRRPRQHWRKAHWHTYWTGKGRAKRELKFIAPMLINDNDDGGPIVKHV